MSQMKDSAAVPKVVGVAKPVSPLTFLICFILSAMATTYYVLVPIFMWIKDQIVPKDVANKDSPEDLTER